MRQPTFEELSALDIFEFRSKDVLECVPFIVDHYIGFTVFKIQVMNVDGLAEVRYMERQTPGDIYFTPCKYGKELNDMVDFLSEALGLKINEKGEICE